MEYGWDEVGESEPFQSFLTKSLPYILGKCPTVCIVSYTINFMGGGIFVFFIACNP